MKKNRYNILQVIDKFSMDGINPSSCAYLIRDWRRYADKERFNLIACGLKKEEPAGHIYTDEEIKVFFLGNGKYSIGNITGLVKLIDREKIDLLHLHGYSSANFGRIAARLRHIPNIVHEHAILKILPHQYLADFLLRNYTDAAIGVSGAVKDFLHSGRHVPKELIRVVYNGVNLEPFKLCDDRRVSELRKEFALNSDHFVIGTLTRLREEKGNQFLIAAMREIVAKHPQARLLITGDGPQRAALLQLIAELGLQEQVKLIGFRTDIYDLLTLYDLVAIPSLNEGFGLVMVEAMAMGKPIVASRVGGMVEISGDFGAALLVPAGQPEALAKGITRIIESPALAQQMAQSGPEASKRFSIQNNVRALEAIYIELLEKDN